MGTKRKLAGKHSYLGTFCRWWGQQWPVEATTLPVRVADIKTSEEAEEEQFTFLCHITLQSTHINPHTH